MTTTITRKLVAGLGSAGAAAAFTVAGASVASAQQYGSFALSPGMGACGNAQYASYQVRVDASATNQGAKFKLLRNGVVIANTPNRANSWSAEFRSAYGNFPSPGLYTVCAQNTGTANTIATLQLRTDSEF